MLSANTFLYEQRDFVATITLNRPERLNALSPEMVAAIPAALTTAAADRACRVIVLTGAGRGFCAGLDLHATTSSSTNG